MHYDYAHLCIFLPPGGESVDGPHLGEHGSVGEGEAEGEDPCAQLAEEGEEARRHVRAVEALKDDARQAHDAARQQQRVDVRLRLLEVPAPSTNQIMPYAA